MEGKAMKAGGTIQKSLPALLVMLVLMMSAPAGAFAQETSQPVFKPEELEQILAPIALYPDSLLAQIFMASTYPLEVVQADRWAKQNKDLKGDALVAALEKQPWDPSVKSLINFPQVLAMMSEKLDWTQKLGDAFLAQQKDTMDAVQRLRKKAADAGTLKTTNEQKVIVEQDMIVIESASPQVVYVPAHNPTVVYGTWAYPSYPPAYYYPPGYVAGTALLSFGAGMALGAAGGATATGTGATLTLMSIETPISTGTSTARNTKTNTKAVGETGSTAPNTAKEYPTATRPPARSTTGYRRTKPSSPGRTSGDVPMRADRIRPAAEPTRRADGRMPAGRAGSKAGPKRGMSPARAPTR
jgi:hypothetical protein